MKKDNAQFKLNPAAIHVDVVLSDRVTFLYPATFTSSSTHTSTRTHTR